MLIVHAATDDPEELLSITVYIQNVLRALIPMVGLIAFIMILVGGFTILTSGGNPESTKKGQQAITMAVGGIILTIIAWLVLLLIENLTGVGVTRFKLGF